MSSPVSLAFSIVLALSFLVESMHVSVIKVYNVLQTTTGMESELRKCSNFHFIYKLRVHKKVCISLLLQFNQGIILSQHGLLTSANVMEYPPFHERIVQRHVRFYMRFIILHIC